MDGLLVLGPPVPILAGRRVLAHDGPPPALPARPGLWVAWLDWVEEEERPMSLLDKVLEVADIAKSEYQRHFGDEDPDREHDTSGGEDSGGTFLPAIKTPEQAYERLELSVNASLDEVRARYREVARLWHPRAHQDGDQADRAQKHLDGYLDALEVLEEHLLPLP
jgi:hypothetical protein